MQFVVYRIQIKKSKIKFFFPYSSIVTLAINTSMKFFNIFYLLDKSKNVPLQLDYS